MSRVVAIFGPTASGKTDVAEAIADRIPADARLRRRDAGLSRAADPHEPVGAPDGARRRLAALARRLARGVPGACAPGRGRGARAREDARRRRRDRPLPPRRGLRPRAPAAAGSGGAGAVGRPLRGARPRGRARGAGGRRRRRGRRRPSERPPARRPRARARGGRSVAEPRARPALERGDAPPDPDRRPRRAPGGARSPHRRADAVDARARRRRRGAGRARGRGLGDGRGRSTGCASSPSCRRSRLPPPTTPACAATPPTSESGCGAFRGSGWSTRPGRPARSRTRSSGSTSRRGAAAGAPPG